MTMKVDSEEQVLVHKEFTYINGVATEVFKCGPWTDLWKNKSAPKVLFLVIPGNPGLAGYYQTFIQCLYSGLNQKYPVWVVSQAGQCKLPNGMAMVEGKDINEPDDVFGIHGQVRHKLKFLQKNVPKDVKLVLIGTSVGCYIALEMMKHAPKLEVLRSVLLFPTIEHLAQSPNGKTATPLLCHLRYALYIPIYLMMCLPEAAKKFFVRLVLRAVKHLDESVFNTAVDMLNMNCVANAMYLGSDEMRAIKERDNANIRKHLKKLTFYYGATDAWCPVHFYEDMKTEFPDGDIRLCEKGLRHAFTLDSSKEVAEMVVDWVQDDLAKL
ncbi:lipid droplet-associated hydrolase [Elgaria multicarinata webbii]|uniref:lipid droplet-associated hydrolase n=1 Tax=Elgaria multicarinata webbii TaxID=159646 RepID=UPI002FCD1DFC